MFWFVFFKLAFWVGAIAFAAREIWLLRKGDTNPELTRKVIKVLGGPHVQRPSEEPTSPVEAPAAEPQPEPMRRAA